MGWIAYYQDYTNNTRDFGSGELSEKKYSLVLFSLLCKYMMFPNMNNIMKINMTLINFILILYLHPKK